MDNTAALENVLLHFKPNPLLCIGDLMLDEFITGEVNRISPEAPIPVLHELAKHQILGGGWKCAQKSFRSRNPLLFYSHCRR